MSLIDKIKEKIQGIRREKPIQDTNQVEYDKASGTVKSKNSTVIKEPYGKKRTGEFKRTRKEIEDYGNSYQYSEAPQQPSLFSRTVGAVYTKYQQGKESFQRNTAHQRKEVSDIKNTVSGGIEKAKAYAKKYSNAYESISSQVNPKVVASVKSGIKARVSQVQKTSIAHDVGYGGNLFIRSMTGIRSGEKNPYKGVSSKTRAAVARAHGKKIKLGRKLSKKEIKGLQAKYGKNWKMAVQQDKQGNFSSQVSPQQRVGIQRENRVDFNRTNIGGGSINEQFPITSEYANVPFGARADVPTDVEGMFLGERGSGLADRSAPRTDYGFGSGLKDIGNNSLFGSSEIKKQKTGTIEFKF